MSRNPDSSAHADQGTHGSYRGWLTYLLIALLSAAAGYGAFVTTRALAAPDPQVDQLITLTQPQLSLEIDPELPLAAALADLEERGTLLAEAPLPLSDPEGAVGEDDPGAPLEDETFDLPDRGPLPTGVARPVREADLRGSGTSLRTAEELAELETHAGPDGIVPLGPPRGPGPALFPAADSDPDTPSETAMPTVLDLGGSEVSEDPAEPPTADEERDDELPLFWPLDPERIAELLPLLRPTEPDYLDVCAGQSDDPEIDLDAACGNGTGATVLAFNTILSRDPLLAVGYDPGPRCADHVDVASAEGFPLRITFFRRPTLVAVTYQGIEDPRQRGNLAVRTDPDRVRTDVPYSPYDQCVLIPYLDGEERIALTIRHPSSPDHLAQLTIPRRQGDRPATILDTLGDRSFRVRAARWSDERVRATVITRSDAIPGLSSQCELVGSPDLPAAQARVVELQPAASARRVPVGGEEPELLHETFRAQLAPVAEERFELCLRWEQGDGTSPRTVHQEAYFLEPPRRPTIEVALGPGTFVDLRSQPWARPLSVALSFQPDGSEQRCELFRHLPDLEADLPARLCAFEAIDGLAGGTLQLVSYPSHTTGAAAEVRSHRVALQTDPAHPRSGERCQRCLDVYDFTLPGFDPARQPVGRVQVVIATAGGGQDDQGWTTFPLRTEHPAALDVPRLDLTRTRIHAAGGQVADRDAFAQRISVNVVADRPVRARLWARPQRAYRPGNPILLPCGPQRVPRYADSDGSLFASEVTVTLEGVCPGSRYRLALELWDDAGNHSVHGDMWTSLMIPIDDESLRLGSDTSYASFVGEWRAAVTVPGRPFELGYEVEITQVHPDTALTPGLYRERPAPPEGPPPGFDFEAKRTRVHLAQAQVGPIGLSRGAHSGDDGCVGDGRTIRADPVHGRVGEFLPVEVRVVLHTLDAPTMAFDHCQGDVRLVREFGLSSYSSPYGINGRHVVSPWELLHRDGKPVYVVAVSEPNPFDDRHGIRFQAIFRFEAPW